MRHDEECDCTYITVQDFQAFAKEGKAFPSPRGEACNRMYDPLHIARRLRQKIQAGELPDTDLARYAADDLELLGKQIKRLQDNERRLTAALSRLLHNNFDVLGEDAACPDVVAALEALGGHP